jgi:hypothetical protein
MTFEKKSAATVMVSGTTYQYAQPIETRVSATSTKCNKRFQRMVSLRVKQT